MVSRPCTQGYWLGTALPHMLTPDPSVTRLCTTFHTGLMGRLLDAQCWEPRRYVSVLWLW